MPTSTAGSAESRARRRGGRRPLRQLHRHRLRLQALSPRSGSRFRLVVAQAPRFGLPGPTWWRPGASRPWPRARSWRTGQRGSRSAAHPACWSPDRRPRRIRSPLCSSWLLSHAGLAHCRWSTRA